MCGIFGRIEPPGTAISGAALRKQTDTLVHRGPDAGGYWCASRTTPGHTAINEDPVAPPEAHIALGHRRLSILDLSPSAIQPLMDADRQAAVIFNGEIYNFKELRQELETKGAKFLTDHSDTEVLIQAWIHWGKDCLKKLRGMFAFLIVDLKQQVFFMARDRIGKKPLYYCHTKNGGLMVASELKALVEDPTVPRVIDPVALGEYLQSGFILSPRTIYKGIHKLPAAHSAFGKLSAPNQLEISSYWEPRFDPGTDTNLDHYREAFEEKLKESTAIRMVADVPVGAFLSGGIDSTRIIRAISNLGANLKTFSIGFEEGAFNELPFAKTAAEHYGVPHHTRIVGPQDENLLDTIAWHYDEPFGDSSAIPTLALSQFTREQVTVALSGDGGDELTAGYLRYKALEMSNRIFSHLPGPLVSHVLGPLFSLYPKGMRGHNLVRNITLDLPDAYFQHMFQPHAFACLQSSLREKVFPLSRRQYDKIWQKGPQAKGMEVPHLQHHDLLMYLPEDIMVKVDRASMAHALEARCPILDHELVEMALKLPMALTFGGGKQKAILKEPLEKELGLNFVNRKKMGFGVPLGSWFSGPWKNRIDSVLLQNPVLPSEVIDPATVRALAASHGGIHNFSAPLYYLLTLAIWWQKWNPTAVGEAEF